ncbi:acylneuraminate cytidylyltransferase family protein [Litorivicinus sp.]|nr:acylneuraminate cytidylyltransferase family protein [Litorivicinus sp.]
MSLLAIIPARGGSKEIPRKNIKTLAGKPLIAWTIEAALQAQDVDRVIVSTEDKEIAAIAKQFGAEVPFMRPLSLARDDTPGIAPVLHAIEQIPDFDWVLLLQPTSPLRCVDDINGIIDFCRRKGASSAVSITEVSQHPFWMYQRDNQKRLQPIVPNRPEITRRQDLPNAYIINGALYLARTDWLVENRDFIGPETLGYVMSPERSVDLDTPQDWRWIEFLIEEANA